MNNPLEILKTLDHHLQYQADLNLFGRAALALGYANAPASFGSTHDVDGIIPITSGNPSEDFWLAQQATNEELKNHGSFSFRSFIRNVTADNISTRIYENNRVFRRPLAVGSEWCASS